MATAEQILEAARAEDATPEALKALLEEHDREHGDRVAEALKAKNREVFGKLDKLKPWKALASETGKTPEEIREELAAAEALRKELEAAQKGVKNDDVEALAEERANAKLESYRAKAQAERKALEERAAKLEETLKARERRLHRETTERLLMRAAGDDVWPDLWGEFVSRLEPCFHEGEDGEMVLVDPKTKTPLPGANGLMTAEELVDAFYASAGSDPWNSKGKAFFKPARGDGARETPGNGRPMLRKKRSEMTPAEKAQFIEEHGAEEFRKLPA